MHIRQCIFWTLTTPHGHRLYLPGLCTLYSTLEAWMTDTSINLFKNFLPPLCWGHYRAWSWHSSVTMVLARVLWLCRGRLVQKWPSASRHMTLITVEICFQGSIPSSLRWPGYMQPPQLTAATSSCDWWTHIRNKSSTWISGKEGVSQDAPLVQGAWCKPGWFPGPGCISVYSKVTVPPRQLSINRKIKLYHRRGFYPLHGEI